MYVRKCMRACVRACVRVMYVTTTTHKYNSLEKVLQLVFTLKKIIQSHVRVFEVIVMILQQGSSLLNTTM